MIRVFKQVLCGNGDIVSNNFIMSNLEVRNGNTNRISVVIISQNSGEPMLPSALHIAPLLVMESKSDSAIYIRGVISCQISIYQTTLLL